MKSLITIGLAALATLSGAVPLAQVGNGVAHSSDDKRELTRKRGVAYNNSAYVKLFDVPNSKVFWRYNWASWSPETNTWYPFIPMLHSDRPDHTGPWATNVDQLSKVGLPSGSMDILSFNEPDQCGNGGSCMGDVGHVIAQHKKFVDVMRLYGPGMHIVTPAVTNGASGPGYLKGLDYLEAFVRGCDRCKLDYAGIHWYDSARNIEYFKKHVTSAHERTGMNIWITEFGFTDPSDTEEDKKKFLRTVLPWLDAQPWVFRYAMQMAASGVLINADGSGLSEVGYIYATVE